MKRLLLVTAMILISCIGAFGQRSESDADRREIERLEVEWNTINEVSDVEGIRRLLADDSYHIGPSGRHYTKQQDITAQTASRAQKESSGTKVKFTIFNRQIRMFTDVAVVTATGRGVTTLADQTRRAGDLFRIVHVWEKRDGRWQLIVDQVTGAGK